MSRAAVFSVLLTAGVLGGLATPGGATVAGQPAQFQHVANSGRGGQHDWRDHRYANGYANGHDDRRDHRRDARRDHGHYGDGRHGSLRYYAPPPRYYAPAPQRYYVPPRSYYNYRHHDRWPYWRESYNGGYRYWDDGRHYFVAPGRPAIELRFVLPLR